MDNYDTQNNSNQNNSNQTYQRPFIPHSDNQTNKRNEDSYLSPEVIQARTDQLIHNPAAALYANNLQERYSKFQSLINQGGAKMKAYFAVSTESVLYKIKTLIYPFGVKVWGRGTSDESLPRIPINNPNEPELYTPIIFCLIWVLLSSTIRSFSKKFAPDYMVHLVLTGVGIDIFFVFISYITFFAVGMSNTFPFLTLCSDFGTYTFYASIISFFSWNSSLRLIAIFYCFAASFFWMLRTLKSEPSISGRHDMANRSVTIAILVLSFLFAIFPLIFVESPIKAPQPQKIEKQ